MTLFKADTLNDIYETVDALSTIHGYDKAKVIAVVKEQYPEFLNAIAAWLAEQPYAVLEAIGIDTTDKEAVKREYHYHFDNFAAYIKDKNK